MHNYRRTYSIFDLDLVIIYTSQRWDWLIILTHINSAIPAVKYLPCIGHCFLRQIITDQTLLNNYINLYKTHWFSNSPMLPHENYKWLEKKYICKQYLLKLGAYCLSLCELAWIFYIISFCVTVYIHTYVYKRVRV